MKQSVIDYCRSTGLLLLRVGFGGLLLFMHGWGKIADFSSLSESFPDPIGLGSTVTLVLAILAEVVCAAAVVVGLFTRIAAILCALAMFVAAFMHHSGGSWGPERELALVYMIGFISIALIGSGAFSADSFRKNK